MKKIFYFILLFIHFSFYAQPSGGGQRGGRQNQEGQQNSEVKKFNASEVAGLFFYDIKKIIKKIKIKDNITKDSVTKLLKNYNFEIREISLLNANKFKDLNAIVNAGIGSRNNTGNQDSNSYKNTGLRKKVQEIIRPIRQEVRENEIKLNENLAAILSEKQNKKWLKYQKAKKDKLKPKKAQRNNSQRENDRGNRQRGGF
jgi:hypothetical protein